MTLTLTDYDVIIEMVENQINEVIIESERVFRYVVENLWLQVNGQTGQLILAENDKELTFSKNAELIMNPFAINLNDKKILTKLYAEMLELAKEDFFEETGNLNAAIVNYLDVLINRLPYDLNFASELDVIGLCKLYKVEIDGDNDSIVSRLIDYLRAMHQIVHVNVFFFVNLKMYLTREELLSIYEFANYEKIHIFIISGAQKEKIIGEKSLIIDKDLCIIEA